VFNRGARREPVFFRDMHCALFLDLLSELPERHSVRVHGFTLMPNHYHLMLETPRGNLSDAMGRLSSIYTQRINRERDWDGSLFRGRYQSKLVHAEEHWVHLLAYIHLNPVRAGLCTRVSEYDWSSHGVYAGDDVSPDWLTTEELHAAFGSRRGYTRYLDDVLKRRQRPPDKFDQVLFERPGSAVHLADDRKPELRMSVDEALKDVMEVTGSPLKELRGEGVNR
jgi:REP element-mobilizing transposase RayT